jgi:hypothetical protein
MELVTKKEVEKKKAEFEKNLGGTIAKLLRRKDGAEEAEDLLFRLRKELGRQKKRFHVR